MTDISTKWSIELNEAAEKFAKKYIRKGVDLTPLCQLIEMALQEGDTRKKQKNCLNCGDDESCKWISIMRKEKNTKDFLGWLHESCPEWKVAQVMPIV